jgi:hypothetical protein
MCNKILEGGNFAMIFKITLTNTLRILSILMTSLFLAACYSIFDPAPYNPQFDSDFVKDNPNVVRFTDLSSAVSNLNILARTYAEKGASLMREQLSLDVPLFGLAAATVASGIYGGSKDLTLGLGLGSAGVAGTKLYFNPQARAAAYNGAALALSCGASVANQLNTIMTTKEDPVGTANTLQSLIDAASNSKDQNLASLVSAGQKALNDLITAIGIIYGAPARLEAFAAAIIRGTTTKAATGVQNIDAAVSAIRAAGPNPSAAGVAPKPGGAAAPRAPSTVEVSIPRSLQTYTALAISVTKDINDAWNNMTSCTIQAVGS